MTLAEFVAALARHWRTFAATTGVVLAVGIAGIVALPATYVSSTQLLVSIGGSTTALAYQNDDVARQRVNSYLPLLTSEVVSQRVVDALHLPLTAAELADRVSATRVPPNTSVIDVAVTADSESDARAITESMAREFISYTDALETPTGMDAQKVRVTEISGASQPRSNAWTRVALGIPATVLAVLLGAVAVWIRCRSERHQLFATSGHVS